jgi:hypothetical protein
MMFLLLRQDTKVGNGKYNMSPGGERKLLLVSQVKCLMVKLQLIKVYRIKGIPGPTGTIRGETGVVKGPKSI